MCPRSIAGVPSSQALPGFLNIAPPSVCVHVVIGALTLWNQNQAKKKIRVVTVRRSNEFAKCQSPPWKLKHTLPSINFRLSFLRIHRKETYKSMDPTSIPPKHSARNSFNKNEKLDHQLLEIWVSFRFFNKLEETDEKWFTGKLSAGN